LKQHVSFSAVTIVMYGTMGVEPNIRHEVARAESWNGDNTKAGYVICNGQDFKSIQRTII
jgi:hypothetical protein